MIYIIYSVSVRIFTTISRKSKITRGILCCWKAIFTEKKPPKSSLICQHGVGSPTSWHRWHAQLPPKCGCRNAENHRHAEHRREATGLFRNPVRGAKRMRAGGSPLRMPMSAALSRSDTDFNRVLLLIKFILSLKISQQKIGDTSPHPRFNQSSQPSCFDVAHLNRQNFFFNSRDL